MNMSPVIAKALMEARQCDALASARQARRAREAGRANQAARAAATASGASPAARRRWLPRLAGLFGAQ